MNITFLIGNGFDINLGLKTRYSDFYDYYISKNHKDLISNDISKSYENWADLEKALGVFLKKISPLQAEMFLNSKGTLEEDLEEYLKKEQKRLDVAHGKKEILACNFVERIVQLDSEFSGKDKNEFQSWKRTIAASIKYQFITFNYTDSLAWILAGHGSGTPMGKHNSGSTMFQDILGEIIHIHGTVDKNLILGLDDQNQIENLLMRNDNRITDYIIKPTMNDLLGEQRNEKVKKVLSESGYICVYGMSFGDTDRTWWKEIVSWLSEQETHRAILFVYDSRGYSASAQQKLRKIKKWKEFFLSQADTPPELAVRIEKQMVVIVNSEIFKFDEIELKNGNIHEIEAAQV